jgi:hypothetical protein
MKFDIRIFCENYREFRSLIKKTAKNNGTSHADQYKFLTISRSVLLRIRNVSYTSVENIKIHILSCGPGSSVVIATGYGLDGPGIESRWGRDFSHTSRPALGPTQPPVQLLPGLSRG